jgi:hypothetical protein
MKIKKEKIKDLKVIFILKFSYFSFEFCLRLALRMSKNEKKKLIKIKIKLIVKILCVLGFKVGGGLYEVTENSLLHVSQVEYFCLNFPMVHLNQALIKPCF